MVGFLEGLIEEIMAGVADGMDQGTVTLKRHRAIRRKSSRRKTTSRRRRTKTTSTIQEALIEALTGKKPARTGRLTKRRSKRRKSMARKP